MNKQILVLAVLLAFATCDEVTEGTITFVEDYFTAPWMIWDTDTEMPKITFNMTVSNYDITPWFDETVPIGIYISIGFFSNVMNNSVCLTCWMPWTDVPEDDLNSLLCGELWTGSQTINDWRDTENSIVDYQGQLVEYGAETANYVITITRYLTDPNDAMNDLFMYNDMDVETTWSIGPHYPGDAMPLWPHGACALCRGDTTFMFKLESATDDEDYSMKTMANMALLTLSVLFYNFF